MRIWHRPQDELPPMTKESHNESSDPVLVIGDDLLYHVDRVVKTHDGNIFHGELFGLYKVIEWTEIPKPEDVAGDEDDTHIKN